MNRLLIVRDGIFLWSSTGSAVVLCMKGQRYGHSDTVPDGLLAKWEQSTGSTAAFLVSEIMRHRFGDDRKDWPDLAREFCTATDKR